MLKSPSVSSIIISVGNSEAVLSGGVSSFGSTTLSGNLLKSIASIEILILIKLDLSTNVFLILALIFLFPVEFGTPMFLKFCLLKCLSNSLAPITLIILTYSDKLVVKPCVLFGAK